jgi:ADP-dependent NAD(P)H-hydrate dehydratase
MTPSPLAEIVVTPAVLRDRPLPDHRSVDTKYDRGVVVVIGGATETPGGVLLAGLAALRVGAGKIQLATVAGVAPALAIAVPEARVIPVPETDGGALDPQAGDRLAPYVASADAVLVGTGASDVTGTGELVRRLVPEIQGVAVIDAGAIPVLRDHPDLLAPLGGRAVVMPNPAEMAQILGCSLDEVTDDPLRALTAAVDRLGVTVTLRGTQTWTAAPGTQAFRDEGGNAGLATSGSGDVLAGAITGLAARGADPLTATIWATHLHGSAADRCAARLGELGYLARELLDELPLAYKAVG